MVLQFPERHVSHAVSCEQTMVAVLLTLGFALLVLIAWWLATDDDDPPDDGTE